MTMIEKAKALVTEVTDAIQGARSAKVQIETTTRDGREKHARIRETVETKLRERDQARDALPVDGDLDEYVRRLIGGYAQAWVNDHGLGMLLQLAGQQGSLELNGRIQTTMGHPRLPLSPNEPMPFGLQCALDPEAMTERWITLIRRIPHQSGSAVAARPALLEQLDRELAELEPLEDQLAIDLGVPRRAAMIEREQRAERASQLEAERLKNRRHAEEAIKSNPTYHTANFKPSRPAPTGRE
jgi:hypothetical protein